MNLLIRRFFAIIIDLVFFLLTSSIISIIDQNNLLLFYITIGVMLFILYAIIPFLFQSTLGGIILNLQIVSCKKDICSIKKQILRFILVTIGLFAFAFCLFISYYLLVFIILITILPMLFTKDKSMLHDIMSRSYIIIVNRKNYKKITKKIILLFISIIFSYYLLHFLLKIISKIISINVNSIFIGIN